MPNRFSFKVFGFLFLGLSVLALPRSAQAGFQWVAPSAPADTTQAAPPSVSPSLPPVESMPQTSPRPEMLKPSSENLTPSAPIELLPPPMPAEKPLSTASTGEHSLGALSDGPPVVHGFANHVPLAVALRAILPAGYGFSVDPSVDLGVLVSFHGGKPWRETLREALEPAGLVMHEQAQMVTISYSARNKETGTPLALTSSSPVVVPAPAVKQNPPETQSHFLTLPPGMVPGPNPAQPPVVIGGAPDMPGVAPMMGAASRSVVESWDAERGDTLRKVLERWCRRADVEFNWMSEYDYPLESSVHLDGTFEDAVRNILTGFRSAHPQPVAELHSNPKIGQPVLVVTARGNPGN